MENENRYLELFSQASRLPLAIFEGNQLMFEADAARMEYNLPMYLAASLPSVLPDIWYAETPEGLFFGGLTLPEAGPDRRLLLLGPVFTGSCTRRQAREIMHRLGRKEADAETFLIRAARLPEVSVSQLTSLLALLKNRFYGTIPERVSMLDFTWLSVFPSSKAEVREATPVTIGDDMETEMLTLVYYGRVRELRVYFNEAEDFHNPDVEEKTSNLELRRSYMFGANMLASRVAYSAGADLDLIRSIAGTHHEGLLRASTLVELNRIFTAFMLDYAGQVAKIHDIPGEDYLCGKISRYVTAHIYDKLSTSSLAEAMKLSTPYVSAHFKKITGMTVTDFISKRKIQEAAYLIGSGHYAVGEVSSLLQFSSQSYFTKIFRKYVGMTPEAYRRSDRRLEI